MKDIPFEDKVAKLRGAHRRSAPEAIAQVNAWSEQFARLKGQKEWLEHPNTQELRHLAVEQIELIDSILCNQENLSEPDRCKYFAMKKAHQVYLSTLTLDPSSEMKSIEESVNDELTDLP